MDHTVTHLGHGYWHQITLGHVYKHHLGILWAKAALLLAFLWESWAMAVTAAAAPIVEGD